MLPNAKMWQLSIPAAKQIIWTDGNHQLVICHRMSGSTPFHTKHSGKTKKRTVDPEVFGLTEPAQSCCPFLLQEQQGVFLSGKGWLICHRSSFESPLCTAAHLDADVRRLASCAEPVPLSVKQRGLEPKVAAFHFSATFFWWDPAVLLPLIKLQSARLHVTQSPLCFPLSPIMEHGGKTEAGREYIEAPATSLTLTLPLWSLNVNWLNELPIWEALVTAYWCVHACVCAHLEVCEINYDDRILSVVVCFLFFRFCFPPQRLFISVQVPLSHNLHKNSISYYTGIDLFLAQTFALEKKGSKMRGWVRQRCRFILVERRSNRWWGLDL